MTVIWFVIFPVRKTVVVLFEKFSSFRNLLEIYLKKIVKRSDLKLDIFIDRVASKNLSCC